LPPVNAAEQREYAIWRLLTAAGALALYAATAGILASRHAGLLFGADAHLYVPIATGEVFDRVFRFHPLTVASAELWMLLHKPFIAWIDARTWLQFLFAAAGAAGVWIATGAFARLVPWRLALAGGVIYALTFSVWFFSSIEESKLVSGTLATLYIAIWLRLREEWTARRAWLLTLVLFAACLNEIVACFLVVIPAVDELLRRGLNLRALRWLVAHGMVFLLALLILETAIPERLLPGTDAEGKSHFSMLLYYLARNDYSPGVLYSFVLNWLLFSVAAPEPLHYCPQCVSYFAPAFASYFFNPWRAAFLVPLCGLLLAMLVPKLRGKLPADTRAVLIALIVYSLLRATFFFVFNPSEAMLYTPSVMLAHLMLFVVIFAAAQIPAKGVLLAVLALLLFIANGLFMLGV
jgi:hypothetical protein